MWSQALTNGCLQTSDDKPSPLKTWQETKAATRPHTLARAHLRMREHTHTHTLSLEPRARTHTHPPAVTFEGRRPRGRAAFERRRAVAR